jgi:hypothetical protein
MTIQVNLGGRKRKALADAVGEALKAKPSYKGPPSYAYEVGPAVIGRDGSITLNTQRNKDAAAINRLLEGLELYRFAPRLIEGSGRNSNPSDETVRPPQDETPPQEAAEESVQPVIRVPLDGFNDSSLENIRLLVDSKAQIIKKALGVNDLTIRKSETTLDFPWFDRELSPQERIAYTNLITAMCEMAKRQRR